MDSQPSSSVITGIAPGAKKPSYAAALLRIVEHALASPPEEKPLKGGERKKAKGRRGDGDNQRDEVAPAYESEETRNSQGARRSEPSEDAPAYSKEADGKDANRQGMDSQDADSKAKDTEEEDANAREEDANAREEDADASGESESEDEHEAASKSFQQPPLPPLQMAAHYNYAAWCWHANQAATYAANYWAALHAAMPSPQVPVDSQQFPYAAVNRLPEESDNIQPTWCWQDQVDMESAETCSPISFPEDVTAGALDCREMPKSAIRAFEEASHLLCPYCKAGDNILRDSQQQITAIFCGSCCIALSKHFHCDGHTRGVQNCLKRRFVNPLGEPAPWCRECVSSLGNRGNAGTARHSESRRRRDRRRRSRNRNR